MPSEKQYFIKPGYRSYENTMPYNDSEEDSLIYQLDVYRYAASHLSTAVEKSVLDIGCGYGLKLKQFILPLSTDITGIDGQHSISYCRHEHSFGTWVEVDIERDTTDDQGKFDMIISADVIEHLFDPDKLLTLIRRHAHPNTLIVLSTPERDLRRGKESMGPPQNRAHIREWNKNEFAAYITDRGFHIQEHTIMDLKEGMTTCQTVLCKTD